MIRILLICTGLGLSGWCARFSFAPYHLFYFAIIAVCAFMMAMRHSKSKREAFLFATIFGFGWFFGQLSWVSSSFQFVNLGHLALPAALLFCLGLSFFMWIPVLTSFYVRENPPLLWLSFSIGWSISEFLRTFIFGGFPWNLIGQVWTLPLLQTSAYIGILGLSLVTVVTFSSLISNRKYLPLFLWCGLALLAYKGAEQLNEPTAYTSFRMRLIQPAIDQKEKWNPDLFDQHMHKQIQLSQKDWQRDFNAIIWPESAVPHFVRDLELVKQLNNSVLKYHPDTCLWITGVPTMLDKHLHNSVLITDKNSSFMRIYHKVHLVPFGEFIPLRNYIPLTKITAGTTDYESGKNDHYVRVKNIPPFATLICYEIIFPHIFDSETQRAEWILNLTNDAWFGNTIGPHQHLQIARTRSIEQGLPLVRATNDGISAITDAYGRLIHTLEKGKEGVIDFDLPKAIYPTLISKWGAIRIYFCLIFIMSFVLFIFLKRAKLSS